MFYGMLLSTITINYQCYCALWLMFGIDGLFSFHVIKDYAVWLVTFTVLKAYDLLVLAVI